MIWVMSDSFAQAVCVSYTLNCIKIVQWTSEYWTSQSGFRMVKNNAVKLSGSQAQLEIRSGFRTGKTSLEIPLRKYNGLG
jgi:hypothetical protein